MLVELHAIGKKIMSGANGGRSPGGPLLDRPLGTTAGKFYEITGARR
jgi:hypothetical protein